MLSRIALKAGETYSHTSVAPETWIVLSGTGKAQGPGGNVLPLSKGKTLFAPFGTAYKVVCDVDLVIFKAAIP